MTVTPVKYFKSSMVGAPQLSGTAGALLSIIDACLIDGFNLVTLSGLVVSGEVLTGTKTSHGYIVNQVVKTAGANESSLNGEWLITSVTANTFLAAAVGVSDATGTGTITCKAAPAGWVKSYSGTNKGAYKSASAQSTSCVLRVDDTGTTISRVVGYESMTDIDTGAGPFPTAAQISGGGYWYKSNAADSATREWVLVASDKYMMLFRKSLSGNVSISAFGDFTSEKSGDAYACMLACSVTNQPASASAYQEVLAVVNGTASAVSSIYMPRSYTQIGSAVAAACFSASVSYVSQYSGQSTGLAYPAPTNNGLLLNTVQLRETGGPLRSLAVPGIFHTPQVAPLTDYDIVTGVDGLAGRNILTLMATHNAAIGRVFVDITGPWA